ncbi:LysR family transcriptional regulator STM3121 [plant metagenome]
MDSRQMGYFVALAETLHFGRAAARVNMSQPPFSRQIAALERELGATLVARNSRNVALTPAGQRFLADARAVLAKFDAACRDARLVAEGKTGELRLGFMMHAAQGVVPKLVRRYVALRPDVRLVLEENTPADIDGMLREGKLDAAITFDAPLPPGLAALPLLRDRLRLIVPSGHALAGRKRVGPKDLAGEDLIAAPAAAVPTLRAAILAYCQSGGVPPRIILEPRLQHTIISLVAEGLGIALVPASLCSELAPGVTSLPLQGAPELLVVLAVQAASGNPAVAPLVALVKGQGG